jgi:hypothetical protein
MIVLVAGPYRSGTGDDPVLMGDNLAKLEAVTLPLFRAGHIPLIGDRWHCRCSVRLVYLPPNLPAEFDNSAIRRS